MSGFAARVAAADRARHAVWRRQLFRLDSIADQFRTLHWAGEKPYDRDRANYIKNSVEKAGCENLESWRMLSKEPNILSRNEEALEQVLFRCCVENGSYFFGKGGHHMKILSEVATAILVFLSLTSSPWERLRSRF